MVGRLLAKLGILLDNVVIFGILLSLAVGGTTVFLFGDGATKVLVDQMLAREQILTLAGANAIGGFFQAAGTSLAILATDQAIATGTGRIQDTLQTYIDRWDPTPVDGIIVTDDQGTVTYNANPEQRNTMVGFNVADRPYFSWAKTAEPGEFRVSAVVISAGGASQGTAVIPVATPLVDDTGRFRGTVVLAVSLQKLTETFVEPLNISERSELYVLRDDGMTFIAPQKELIGQTVFQRIEEHPFLGDSVIANLVRTKLAEAGTEGTIRLAYPKSFNQVVPLEERLVAYHALAIADQRFYLALTTPVSDAIAYLTPFYLRGLAILVLFFGALTFYFIRLSRKLGQIEEDRKHGWRHAKSSPVT